MTNEQIIKEFTRWILAGTPGIWIKQDDSTIWYLEHTTCWTSSNATYIVDDEHAELRKLQVNDPDTKFQWFTGQRWRNCGNIPNWDIGIKYRIKPEPKVERRWRHARDENEFTTITNFYMSDSYAKKHKYFKDGWYKLENNYIDVLIDKE